MAKRHPGLIALSHDHHHGLAFALRLRLGDRALLRDGWTHDVREQRERLREFSEEELRPHFQAEEQALFPAIRTADPGAGPLLDRLIADHREMEARLAAIREMDPAQLRTALAGFGGLLEAHIRREERDLFTPLAAALPDETLRAVGERVEEARRTALAAGRSPAFAEGSVVVPARADRVYAALTDPGFLVRLFPPDLDARVSGAGRLRPGARLTLTLFGERTVFVLEDLREDVRVAFRSADQPLCGILRLDCTDVRGGRQVRCSIDFRSAAGECGADGVVAGAAAVLARAIPERLHALITSERGG